MTELTFKGKEFVYNHHLSVPFRPLEIHPEKSLGDPSLDDNLIIQGDNLHALKALLPFYAGRVDCIFIDPPYNTGHEGWCYNDNVNAPMIREWLDANPIGIEDGLRHDKWCAMMWPRLRLLKELLAENGSLWMTLDDNEVHRAKLILDEIFGAGLFSAEVVWQSSDNSNNDAQGFSGDKNYILVYANDRSWNPYHLTNPEKRKHFKNPTNDPRGPWFDGNPVDSPNPRENLKYKLPTPSGGYIDHPKNGWRWEFETIMAKIKAGEIRFSDDETRIIRRTYLQDMKGLPPSDLWTNLDKYGHNRNAKYELQNIFGGSSPFPTPKPSKLIEAILDLAATSDAIILDSFAGSATTAHAVLSKNKRDGGSRRFILVEMEENANEVTAERVRRVIDGYAYKGTQRTELMREKITWSKIKRPRELLDQVEGIQNLYGYAHDRIRKQVKNGTLIVWGENAVDKKAEGLGGTFTYCTLGRSVELDKLLTGETRPPYEALGSMLFSMATNQALELKKVRPKEFYLGEASGLYVWLLYKPDLDWLQSPEAALTLERARAFAEHAPDHRHLVIAPTRYVSHKILAEENLPVEFAPLPDALFQINQR